MIWKKGPLRRYKYRTNEDICLNTDNWGHIYEKRTVEIYMNTDSWEHIYEYRHMRTYLWMKKVTDLYMNGGQLEACMYINTDRWEYILQLRGHLWIQDSWWRIDEYRTVGYIYINPRQLRTYIRTVEDKDMGTGQLSILHD